MSDHDADNYAKLGASASKAGLHRVLDATGLADTESLFARLLPDLAGDKSYRSFIHCDGAGTKTIIAYLLYRMTGERKYFAGLAADALVMNIDDVYCTGAPESIALANTIARNAKLIDDDIVGTIIGSYVALVDQLRGFGIPIEITGGETADCGDVVRTLMVDAVVAGRMRSDSLVYPSRIAAGDVVVGLSSSGQALGEEAPNSGIGSNGLTLARHSILSSWHADQYPEVVDPAIPADIRYRGQFKATDRHPTLPISVGEALLSPTRSYAPLLHTLLPELGDTVHGIIHLTGGAHTKVLRFLRGVSVIKDALFPTPPLFALIQAGGAVPWREMYQVFNMGHRMEIYLPEEHAGRVIDAARKFRIDAQVVGRVVATNAAPSVQLIGAHGTFEYSL